MSESNLNLESMPETLKQLTHVVQRMNDRADAEIEDRIRKLERESDSRLAFTLEHHNAIMETSRDVKVILLNQSENARRLDSLETWRAAIMAICVFCGIILGWIFSSGISRFAAPGVIH